MGWARRPRRAGQAGAMIPAVPAPPPYPPYKSGLHRRGRFHECRRNPLLVASLAERAENSCEDGGIKPNSTTAAGVRRLVALEAEQSVDNATYVVPVVLFLFVERECDGLVGNGPLGKIVPYECTEIGCQRQRNELFGPLGMDSAAEHHRDRYIPGITRRCLGNSRLDQVVADL